MVSSLFDNIEKRNININQLIDDKHPVCLVLYQRASYISTAGKFDGSIGHNFICFAPIEIGNTRKCIYPTYYDGKHGEFVLICALQCSVLFF